MENIVIEKRPLIFLLLQKIILYSKKLGQDNMR